MVASANPSAPPVNGYPPLFEQHYPEPVWAPPYAVGQATYPPLQPPQDIFQNTGLARAEVARINQRAKDSLGYWGRNAEKYLDWTLVGLPIGVHATNKAGKRISAELPADLEVLQRIHDLVKAVPPKQRTPAQRALKRHVNIALRKFQPTLRTHTMKGLEGAGWAAIAAAVVAVVVGVAILCAEGNNGGGGGGGGGFFFFGPWGGCWSGGGSSGANWQGPRATRPKAGDDLPVGAVASMAGAGYPQV